MKTAFLVATSVLLCVGAYGATTYDQLTVNGHAGYLTAMETSPDGVVDKVILLVSGYDSDNNGHPIDDLTTDFQPLIDMLGADGWDIVLFDYVLGDIDIHLNSDNLARYIEYLDTIAVPDYHLAIVGGSMGGIVTRAMFCQELSNMGADQFVSVDSPHHGVYLSPWVEGLAVLLIDTVAGHQMAEGQPEFNTFYGWMRSTEASAGFMANIIDPMDTFAIALSNGENPWEVSWTDLIIHTKYHPVCSYVTAEGLESDYMPYHSTILFDNRGVDESTDWGHQDYEYDSTVTSYFDAKQPNPKTEHSAPPFAVQQAVDFIVAHGPTTPPPPPPPEDTTPPVLTLVGDPVVTLHRRDTYVELGATVYDEGDPECEVVIGGDVVDTRRTGTYVVTYDATDASGNVADQITRTVNVIK